MLRLLDWSKSNQGSTMRRCVANKKAAPGWKRLDG